MHTFWILKSTVSIRKFFWAPETNVQTDEKKVYAILFSIFFIEVI